MVAMSIQNFKIVREKKNIKESIENQNDWAKNIKDDPIHIDNAKSGAKGYYCLGCNKEMQAVKFKNPKHQSYFRHHAYNIDKNNVECVFSSKVYRERLAEQILHRLKELKLPEVYKYPPKGVEGEPNLIQEKETITAFKVRSQLSFYENYDGMIKWGKNPDLKNRYLLIRPDITFFNKDDNPILFVEFVITHKITFEKRAKLQRLGINTVQIIIPKSPESEIEKSLKSVRKIKWVYNEIEANTEYISIPKGNTKGVSSFDEEQRKLFEESYTCRAAQISNLIRSITRCVESQSYKRTEQIFESEISRIEKSAERNREKLESLEGEYQNGVYEEFRDRFDEIENGFRELKARRKVFSEKSRILEERYYRKDREIREEEDNVSRSIRKYPGFGEAERKLKESYEFRRELIRTEFIGNRIRLEEQKKEVELTPERIEKLKQREVADIERRREEFEYRRINLPARFKELEREEQQSFDKRNGELKAEIKRIRKQISGFGEFAREEEKKLENEFEKLGEQSIKRINEEDGTGDSELSKRINAIHEIRGFLRNYNEKRFAFERNKSALEFVRSGAWKTWQDS